MTLRLFLAALKPRRLLAALMVAGHQSQARRHIRLADWHASWAEWWLAWRDRRKGGGE